MYLFTNKPYFIIQNSNVWVVCHQTGVLDVPGAPEEGMGKGEFSAWTNNLRALAGAAAPVIIGNYYSWCLKKKVSTDGMGTPDPNPRNLLNWCF